MCDAIIAILLGKSFVKAHVGSLSEKTKLRELSVLVQVKNIGKND